MMGYGSYHHRKGLILTEAGINVVEEEIRRHHILEKFLEKNLNMTHGLAHSQQVLLLLTDKGFSREVAYRLVQRNAMAS